MKKKLRILAAATAMTLLTGCIAETYPLTEEEQNMIAEYAAGVLLRNDEGYTQPLITPTPIPATLTPTPEPSKPGENATPTPKPSGDTGSSGGGAYENQNLVSFRDVFGIEGLDVSYQGFQCMDQYQPAKGTVIRPEKGKQLVFVFLLLTNTLSDSLSIDLGAKGMSYRLDCNGDSFVKPEITVLEDDILYYSTVLSPEQKKEVFLVFQVKEGVEISGANLIASGDDVTAILPLTAN